jgi:hypothetical protein
MSNTLPVVLEATTATASSALSTPAIVEAIISVVALAATATALVLCVAIELPLLLTSVVGLGAVASYLFLRLRINGAGGSLEVRALILGGFGGVGGCRNSISSVCHI